MIFLCRKDAVSLGRRRSHSSAPIQARSGVRRAVEGTVIRNRGTRFEVLRMRPHDHMGWVFSGRGEFAALAAPYLAEGVALGELVMYLTNDLNADDVDLLAESVDARALRVASIDEIYGPARIVHPVAQRATYAGVLADALADGFTGVRVAADNTPLVADEERLESWIRWEIVADLFMTENTFTGLCAFDAERVDIDRLRHLATLHPMSSATSPVPQFRLFCGAGGLFVEGEMDSFAVTQLWLALDHLPPRTKVVVDLSAATLMSRVVLAGLRQLCEAGVEVTIRGGRAAIGELREACGPPGGALVLQET